MNLSIRGIKPGVEGDPDYADYWLHLVHLDTGIGWEVPLSKEEASKLKRYLPKKVQEELPGIKDFWKK